MKKPTQKINEGIMIEFDPKYREEKLKEISIFLKSSSSNLLVPMLLLQMLRAKRNKVLRVEKIAID